MGRRSNKLYLEVTRDRYELPIFVTEDYKELARFAGTKPEYVLQQIWRWRIGRMRYPRFVTVDLDESEV